MIALLLIPIAILAFLLWQAGRRYDAAQTAMAAEREDWAKERGQLLNRIQRPDIPVIEDFQPARENAYVGYDDDEGFWKAREETLT